MLARSHLCRCSPIRPVSTTRALTNRSIQRPASGLVPLRGITINPRPTAKAKVFLLPVSKPPSTSTMPGARDVSSQSDIAKMNTDSDGSFKRKPSTFRNTIEKGAKFEPEKDRYHLYVSYACPWACRTLIVRKLKGLEEIIPFTVVSPHMGEHGWPFANVDPFPAAGVDPVNHAEHVKDLYFKADPNYDGRFTVPVLWDKKHQTIVNNESSEIIRIFNSAFNGLVPPEKAAQAAVDLYPEPLRAEIDSINDWVYNDVNNGVYKSGFATTQDAYEAAVTRVFAALDRIESLLAGRDFLVGDTLTEADVRLFVTIVRFDPVYVGHFKCNLRTIRAGYPNIHLWLRKLYWTNPAFSSTTNFDHIKTHYYWSHPMINPHRIIPTGPVPNIEPLH
ncbi:glutathione S-transferase [Phellopilus nigrolimitatus]|nr:glutathione S-transferase [Phellopilus nigrolimitatus]